MTESGLADVGTFEGMRDARVLHGTSRVSAFFGLAYC
jgi:hypothetical protein